MSDQLLGPVVLLNRQTAAVYRRLLVNDLPVLLEHVTRHVWFMHDEAPTYVTRTVRQYLTQVFCDQWIGRGGRVDWPARSPDLTPLDFWLWRLIKALLCSAPIPNLEVLDQRVENA
jgi:hypothetical protein